MIQLLELSKIQIINLVCIIAKNQKKGKGQYGKKWTSYNGNLFVSIFFSS